MDKLTLRKLYNTEFPELYKKLQIGIELSDEELENRSQGNFIPSGDKYTWSTSR